MDSHAGAWEPENYLLRNEALITSETFEPNRFLKPVRFSGIIEFLFLIELLMPMTGIPAIGVFSIDFTRY